MEYYYGFILHQTYNFVYIIEKEFFQKPRVVNVDCCFDMATPKLIVKSCIHYHVR